MLPGMEISLFTGGMAMTNGWLAQAGSVAVAVDAPEGMAEWLDRRGVTVSTLMLTHQHFDHVQDAALIQRGHGARVLAFADYSPELTLEVLMEMATGMRVNVEPFRVDELLEGRSQVEAAGVTWRLEHIPGHSADSLTFYSGKEGILFAGDVLFAGSIGRTDFPGGSTERLVRGIVDKLMPLPDETRVLPGHGPETTIGAERMENPFLA